MEDLDYVQAWLYDNYRGSPSYLRAFAAKLITAKGNPVLPDGEHSVWELVNAYREVHGGYGSS